MPNDGQADFKTALALKTPLLAKAAKRMLSGDAFEALRADMTAFRRANPWVEDSALFACLRAEPERKDVDWWDWEAAVRDREPETLAQLREQYRGDIDEFIAIQAIFDRQWQAVKVSLVCLVVTIMKGLIIR